jgi:outer membrane protein OmpA-like peptidoglycan-associated protein
MTPRRTVEIRTLIGALLIGAALAAGLGSGAPGQAAEAGDDTLLQPTPLVLKDGRSANVSVHVLSFPPGQSVLGAANAQRLDSLSAELATDCFLTAQVIGHVGSAEVGNDTLGAHRLARARADAVQASLIADGLPAKAIASVWDWQFMVREPRATIWVFRLTPGEDCEGKPVDAAAPALVARAEPAPAATRVSDPRPIAPTGNGTRPEPAAARDRGPGPAAVARAAEAPPAAVAVPAGPAQARAKVPSVTQALPAVSPNPVPPVSPNPVAAVSPSPAPPASPNPVAAASPNPVAAASSNPVAAASPNPVAAASPNLVAAASPSPVPALSPMPAPAVASGSDPSPARPGAEPAAVAAGGPVASAVPQVVAALPAAAAEPPARPAAAGAEELVITFPSNSSYFPPDAGTQLQALLHQLAAGQHYRVVLRASVSGAQKVVGAETPEEAAKYNQWLAERRVDRIRSWLDQNAAGNALVVKPEYQANDESRQVVVRLIPDA